MALLDLMESQYYELQLQLYDIQAEILQCEELLLAAQLDSTHRQMTGTLHADSRVVWTRKIKHIRVYRLIFEGNCDKKSKFQKNHSHLHVCLYTCVRTCISRPPG